MSEAEFVNNEDLLDAAVQEAEAALETEAGTPSANNTEDNDGEESAPHVANDSEAPSRNQEAATENSEQTEPKDEGVLPLSEEGLIGGKFRSQEELLKAYEESERRITEIGQEKADRERQYQAALEEYAAWANEQEHSSQQGQLPPDGSPTTVEELDELIHSDPISAAAWAADYAPEYMPRVIGTIRQFEPEAAEEIEQLYNDWKMDQKLAPVYERERTVKEHESKVMAARQFANDFTDYSEYAGEIKDTINSLINTGEINLSDPAEVYSVMEYSYYRAKARSSNKTEDNSHKVAGGSLEIGTPGYTPPTEQTSEEDLIASEVLEYANKGRSAIRKFLET